MLSRRTLDLTGSAFATFARAGRGMWAQAPARRPEAALALYEFEACPYCRLVREALTELDLDALIYPCPKGGQRFRPEVARLGGKTQFPFLVDPNTERSLYESRDIVAYLFKVYGGRTPPLGWRLEPVNRLGSFVATAGRARAGMAARPSCAPDQQLELYSFESSPFARLVRERLCELELPYLLRTVGRTSATDFIPPAIRDRLKLDLPVRGESRVAMQERVGTISIPTLIDPNTGTQLAESEAILDYLDRTYAAADSKQSQGSR